MTRMQREHYVSSDVSGGGRILGWKAAQTHWQCGKPELQPVRASERWRTRSGARRWRPTVVAFKITTESPTVWRELFAFKRLAFPPNKSNDEQNRTEQQKQKERGLVVKRQRHATSAVISLKLLAFALPCGTWRHLGRRWLQLDVLPFSLALLPSISPSFQVVSLFTLALERTSMWVYLKMNFKINWATLVHLLCWQAFLVLVWSRSPGQYLSFPTEADTCTYGFLVHYMVRRFKTMKPS